MRVQNFVILLSLFLFVVYIHGMNVCKKNDFLMDNNFLLEIRNQNFAHMLHEIIQCVNADWWIREFCSKGRVKLNSYKLLGYAPVYTFVRQLEEIQEKYRATKAIFWKPGSTKSFFIRLNTNKNVFVSSIKNDCMQSSYVYQFYVGYKIIEDIISAL